MEGENHAPRAVLGALEPQPPFTLNDVYLVKPNEPTVRAIQSMKPAVGKTAECVDIVQGGMFVEAALVYG